MPETRILEILLKVRDQASRDLASLQNTVKGMQPTFKAMAVGGAAAFGAIAFGAKSALDASISYESAFAGVRKTVDASEQEFQNLSDAIRELSKEIPISANELAGIGEIAGQLGVGVNDLEKFIEVIAKIGVTTNLTSQDAAVSFARIANVMQLPLDQVDRMGASVVDLGNNFATTEGEISDFAQRIAGAGNIAGLTVDQVLAIGAAMSSVGVQAEAGGTAVQKVLIGINTAVQTSSEELEVFAGTAGVTAEEFARIWQEDAGQAFTMFVEGLGVQGDSAISTLQALGLEDQRLVRSFLSLANAGDILESAIKTSNEAWDDNLALTEEAAKRFKTGESQLRLLSNTVFDLKVALGETLAPVLLDIVNKLKPIIENVIAWVKENPKLARNIVIAAGAIAGLVAILGTLGLLLPGIIASVKALGVVLTTLTGPIGIVIAALGGLLFFINMIRDGINGLRGQTAQTSVEVQNMSQNMSVLNVEAEEAARAADKARVNIKDFGGAGSKAAGEVADKMKEVRKEIENVNKEIQRLNNDALEANAEHNRGMVATKQELAEAFVKQEQRVKDLEDDLRKASSAEEIQRIQNELNVERQALDSRRNLEDAFLAEINEARRKARLTDFEREVEDILHRQTLADIAFDKRINQIQAELKIQEQKRDELGKIEKDITSTVQTETSKRVDIVKSAADEVVKQAKRASEAINQSFAIPRGPQSTPLNFTPLPRFAEGGIVTKPTIGLIGENGPEAIVPLDGSKARGGVTINITGNTLLDEQSGLRIAEMLMNRLNLETKVAV